MGWAWLAKRAEGASLDDRVRIMIQVAQSQMDSVIRLNVDTGTLQASEDIAKDLDAKLRPELARIAGNVALQSRGIASSRESVEFAQSAARR